MSVDLARRIAAGDRAAEAELVARYSRGLLYHLRRMTPDPALADDLHQDTFRVVLERLRGEGLADPERLGGFLLRTARNLFLGGYRKQARRGESQPSPEAAEPPDPSPSQLARVLRAEEDRAVQSLLGELGTPRDRQILLRFYVAEEDKERICADLDLSPLHFSRVLFRARQRFKELLGAAGRSGVR